MIGKVELIKLFFSQEKSQLFHIYLSIVKIVMFYNHTVLRGVLLKNRTDNHQNKLMHPKVCLLDYYFKYLAMLLQI